tara:strand:- start:667 stop:948 length:282 start_codon:yes stop_codon:yes gene_type:complete
MNKTELIEAVAKDTKLTKADVAKVLNSVSGNVTKALKKGKIGVKVTLPGFLTFEKAKRNARKGRNPQTGKEIKIAAKTVVKVKAGKTIQDAIS